VLKKNELKPWRTRRFCIPPEHNAAFVAAMEDVLEVYQRPYDPKRPQVCIDETSKQLVEHIRTPIPASPGTLARVDDEYKRCGTANIFLCVETLTGETVVEATEHRAKIGRCQGSCRIKRNHAASFLDRVSGLRTTVPNSKPILYTTF
jgi:hypothetical protein